MEIGSATVAVPHLGESDSPIPHLEDTHILVAEDNVVNQTVAIKMLEKMGVHAEVAGNGKLALECLQNKVYDAVLMDCQMPEMDGFEATRKIRENPKWKDLPVVALTAHALPEEKRKCFECGMNEFVNKPLDYETLARTLAKLLPHRVTAFHPAEGDAEPVTQTKSFDFTGAQSKTNQGTGEYPPVDWQVLNRLKEFSGGTDNLVQELVKLFFETSPSAIEGIKAAIDQKDGAQIKDQAHALKSASSNLGIKELAYYCQQMEFAGENKPGADLPANLYPKLFQAYGRAVEELIRGGYAPPTTTAAS
jgi:CheY-like chemotaxis protein/HPt (histidine-containing phosphotransfer) domain-containing protein